LRTKRFFDMMAKKERVKGAEETVRIKCGPESNGAPRGGAETSAEKPMVFDARPPLWGGGGPDKKPANTPHKPTTKLKIAMKKKGN